jgi:antitoxin (DNA-binding transcriptional repressor) of toxin-antitoxin stability system
MQFMTVRQFRADTAKVWRKLPKEKHMVITSRGKPVAILTATDSRRVGDTILEIQRQEASAALKRIREGAQRRGLSNMSMDEIDAEIAASRRERREKRPSDKR